MGIHVEAQGMLSLGVFDFVVEQDRSPASRKMSGFFTGSPVAMSPLASLIDIPSFSWLELSGVVPCHVILAVLIGLAFRRHRDELSTVWEFTGSAACWWMGGVGGVALLAGLDRTSPSSFSGDLFSWPWRVKEWLDFSFPLLSIALYAWAFQQRHGSEGIRRFGVTILLSGILHVLWNVTCHDLYNWPRIDIFNGDALYPLVQSFEYVELPSWGAALGWIIWYIGLFGGKPVSQNLSSA